MEIDGCALFFLLLFCYLIFHVSFVLSSRRQLSFYTRRVDCCASEWRLGAWRGVHVVRVTRLSEAVTDWWLLRYLQPATEQGVPYNKDHPISKYPLTRSVLIP